VSLTTHLIIHTSLVVFHSKITEQGANSTSHHITSHHVTGACP